MARSPRSVPKAPAPPGKPHLARATPTSAPPPPARSSDFEVNLTGKLEAFAKHWSTFRGTEQAGAQEFLQALLGIYEVSFKPGTIFEQHPMRGHVPGSQGNLFSLDVAPRTTTERMDMYLPKVCVWEMKAPSEKQLEKHHDQVLRYWARMRTRFMVLCNFHEFLIYDTDDESGHLTPKLRFPIMALPAHGDALLFLRGDSPDLEQRSERVTAEVAKGLGRLVRELIAASPSPDRDRERVAKFALECVFAMFAEHTGLVPPRMFTNAMHEARDTGKMDPVWSLFDDFATRDTRRRTHRFAPYVNGPIFDASNPKISLNPSQIQYLYQASTFDWQGVRPEIFGSIFEQALDIVERHELGAHFTREQDIQRVVEPTVLEPWRQRISAIRTPKEAERVVEQMKAYHVLDPACGCGNFLYVIYREMMKRLESALVDKWISVHRASAKRKTDLRPPPARPYFGLHQIHGIELNAFAAFLARVVLWIGEHLSTRELDLDEGSLPLKSLDETIRHEDALFSEWPRPDGELAIVGNPPYLGVRKMRAELGNEYVDAIFDKFPDNHAADLVTYWFTRAVDTLKTDERAGFVCTNSVAQNDSRVASIDRIIKRGGTITDAWKSYPWAGEAAVHVSIVNWVMSPYGGVKTLDGRETPAITPSLTNSIDLTTAPALDANKGLCFMGVTPGNEGFVLTDEERAGILAEDRGSAKVIKPYLIGRDVNREIDQKPSRWIIDFGMMMEGEAERYAGAMRHVRKRVYPIRKDNRREAYAKNWWRFVEARPGLRRAIFDMTHVLTITAVGPHLIVTRHDASICFDHKLYVVAVDSFYHLGLLQSASHLRWVRGRPSTLKGDLSYANTTNFETFPFPRTPTAIYDPRTVPVGESAQRLTAAAVLFSRLRSEASRVKQVGLTKIHNLLHTGELPELGAAYEAMNDAADVCYGFPAGTWRDERETLRLLRELNQQIAEPVNVPRQRTPAS